MREMASIVVDDPQRHRPKVGSPGHGCEQLGDVPYALREGPGLPSLEQLAVLLHRGSAAGRVDDDVVEFSERLERSHRRSRPGDRRLLLAAVELQRTAAIGHRRREHLEPLRRQRGDRGPMHLWVEDALYAAEQ